MKKVLVLAMVLGLASLSNAAFQLSVVPGTPGASTIAISSTTDIVPAGGDEMYWALMIEGGTGTLSGGVAVPSGIGFDLQLNGDISSSGLSGNGIWGTLFTTGGPIPAGVLFNNINLTGAVVGTVINLREIKADFSDFEPGNIASFTIVPEPVTMSLLALGGLCLRRRK